MHRAGHAQVIGEAIGSRAREHDDLVFLFGHIQHGQCGRRHGHIDNRIHTPRVKPFARLVGCNVGLVLVVCQNQLHLLAQHLATEIINGHLRCGGTAGPRDVGKRTIHVRDQPQPDHVVRNARSGLRLHGNGTGDAAQGGCQGNGMDGFAGGIGHVSCLLACCKNNQTVAIGVTGEPMAPGRRRGGAVSMKRVRWCSRSHWASSRRYHSSPSGNPSLNRQWWCNGSKG